jgi:hypothetical protein
MKSGLTAVFPLIVFIFSNSATAQSRQDDSIFYQTAISNTVLKTGKPGSQIVFFEVIKYLIRTLVLAKTA